MKNKRLLQGLFIALVALFSLSGAYAQNVITMTTSKKVGEEIDLTIVSKGSFTVQGVTHKGGYKYELTATDGRITLKGDITHLDCSFNQLTQLDVTKNTALEGLDCSYNQLTQLDVTKNTALKVLGCSKNQLTHLDVTKNTALKRLLCDNNQLTKLDVTKNTILDYLHCDNNQLTQLDVSQNKNLVKLRVFGNRIKRASMDRLVEQLPSISIPEDEEGLGFFVAVDTKNPNEGNYLTQSSAAKAKSKGWKVRDYNNGKDANGEWNGEGIPYEGESGFITMTTRKKVGEVLTLRIESKGSFTVQGATQKGFISNYELTATDGRIKIIGDITHLSCSYNQLTQLDVTKNTVLEKLVCNNNQLTKLDVTKNTALEKLYCYNNQLTHLDVTKNTALKDLDCDQNQLTQLDVTKNTALEKLYCSENELTHLDVTKNTKLEGLDCSRNKLKQLNVTKNTALSYLDCSHNQLTQLDVTKNTKLEKLDCSYNQLTQLDITKNTALKKLDCLNNQLTQLDVTKNTALEKLFCDFNQLTQLDITKNTKLEWLDCSHNQLTQLDVTKNTKLEKLVCYNNQLTHLDVTKNTALVKLSCSENELTQLDVTKNTKLEWLNCYNNQLTQLDVTKNIALKGLNCYNNQLTQLDVSQNKNLVNLWVFGNRIKRASMNSLVEQLPSISIPEDEEELGFFVAVDTKNPNEGNYLTQSSAAKAKSKGWKVRDYNNGRDANGKWNGEGIPYEGEIGFITMTTSKKVGEVIFLGFDNEKNVTVKGATKKEGNVYTITATDGRITLQGDITQLYCDNNQLTQLDVTKSTALERLYCYNNQLTQLDITKNPALENLYCYNNQLTQLDVTKNTALKVLYCYNNQLTQLDVTKNTALKVLYCYNNQLTQLDVTKNTALKDLYCSYNQLTQLDVTKNTALKELYCYNNQLTQLDVTKNTELLYLDCDNNQLTQLDVSQNKNLVNLWIYGNRIERASMDRLVEQLPSISIPEEEKEDKGFFVTVDTKNPNEGNYLTQSSAAKAKSKGWKVFNYNNGEDTNGEWNGQGIPYEGESGFITMTTRKKVGEEITLGIESKGSFTVQGVTHKGGYKYELTATDGRITLKGDVTQLYCSYNQLTKLDVTKNTALEYLLCDNNQLTQLDVTKNTKLRELGCSENQLTQLDISQNKNLVNLLIYGNRIKRASMNSLVEQLPSISIPEEEKEDKGFFVAVDTKNPNEGNYLTQSSAAKAKSKGWKVRDYNNGEDANGKWNGQGIPYEGEKDTAIEAISTTSLRLYPNPARNFAILEGVEANALIQIYTLDGVEVLRTVANEVGNARLNLSEIPAGNYIVKSGITATYLQVTQ